MTTDATTSNVTDKPIIEDSLDTSVYAHSLVKFIKQAETPFTIAIQGEWGSGKTSLMRKICYELCGDSMEGKTFIHTESDTSFCGVWLDTWECGTMRSPEDIQVQVISGLAEAIGKLSGMTDKMQQIAKEAIKPLLRLTNFALGATLQTNGLPTGITSILDKGISELLPGNESQSIKKFRFQLAEAVRHVKEKSPKGILFFIDDLDRIPPKVAVDILEILKNLFEVDGCIFVLAIDYNVVIQGLEGKFGGGVDESGRNFNSFFHKIIQLPFSMPVASYRIVNFLNSMLKNIHYCSEDQLMQLITKLDEGFADRFNKGFADRIKERGKEAASTRVPDNVSTLFQRMVELSTSKNPRSIKRLINSLSLIKIILDEQNEPLSHQQKWLCFGVLCVQIAYPRIYEMFLVHPEFVTWDEKFARRQGLSWPNKKTETTANASEPDKTTENIDTPEEFKELAPQWKQVTFLATQHETWMKTRLYDILDLLTLLACCVPENELEQHMRVVLTLTATTGTSPAAPQENRLSRGEFLTGIHDNAARTLMESFFGELDRMFLNHDALDEEYPSRAVARVRVKHASNLDLLLRIKTDGQKVERQIQESSDPKYRSFQNLTPDEIQQGSSFFKELLKVYNALATGEYMLF